MARPADPLTIHDGARMLVLEIELPGFYIAAEEIVAPCALDTNDDGDCPTCTNWDGIGMPPLCRRGDEDEIAAIMNCEDAVQVVFLYNGDYGDPQKTMKVLEGRIIKRKAVPR